MSARRRPPEAPTLFDLPLAPDEPQEAAVKPAPTAPAARVEGAAEATAIRATLRHRLAAGGADLAFVLLVALGVAATLALARIEPSREAALGFGVLLIDFSFLYMLLPLAFWGRTPGMAWAGVRVVADDGGLPSFRRCALRWLGGVLTLATGGLLLVVTAIGNRSLADRLSASSLVLT